MSNEDEFDVVIIGSGAAGAAVAWRLSLYSNLKIACIEQGDFATSEKYPSAFADWENRATTEFSFQPKVRNNWADYDIDDAESPIKISNFNGVGGSTVLFSGHYPRFHPSDFYVKDLDGVADNWPITYKHLEPYYSINDSVVGVAGMSGDPAYPEIEGLLPPIPLGKMGERVASGFNKLDWHWWPSYAAINTSSRNRRPVCINLGPCNSGCSQGAKSSADVTYWPLAINNGVRLITSTRVLGLDPSNSEQRVESLRYVNSNGQHGRITAKSFVVACNGIGTPRLLLASKSKKFPLGLGNNNSLLGRNLMLHPLAYVEGVVSEDISSSIGPQGCCLQSQQFYETQSGHAFKRGFTMQILRSPGPLVTAQQGIKRKRINFGQNFHTQFNTHFNKTISISMITEDLPEVHNQVSLSPRLDKDGFPIPKIQYKLSSNTKEMLKFSICKGKELLKAIGAIEILSYAPVSFSGWHLMGTARMGNDPESSVTNRFGKVHELENLFIADSSLFVTSGAVNPASTIQALALYVADNIASDLGCVLK